MKIGIFDSGLGGLLMTRSIRDAMPEYDFVYFGDTLHVPYGRRSADTIYDLTRRAVEYLFTARNCQIVILACNTASAAALRRLQQTWLAETHPDRRILGVVVPTLEAAIALGHTRIGLIGTESTIHSHVYEEELRKLNPAIELFARATPLLVPMIEHNGEKYAQPILRDYLAPLKEAKIQSLILGCTHYPLLKTLIQDEIGNDIPLISQAEIIPERLKDYLQRHPEYEQKLSRHGDAEFLVTDLTEGYSQSVLSTYGEAVNLRLVTL